MTDATPGKHRGDPGTERVTLDHRNLRALAHPVRMQLLAALRRHGTSTVTRLADIVGVSSGTASYHVRQLAGSGFVEEDTERGNARERWWRAVHRTTTINADTLFDQEPEATLSLLQSVAAIHTQRLQQGVAEYQTLPREWRRVADLSDFALRLTPEETDRLGTELQDVVARYRQDSVDAARAEPDGTARVVVALTLLPEPDDAVAPDPSPNGPGAASEDAGPGDTT